MTDSSRDRDRIAELEASLAAATAQHKRDAADVLALTSRVQAQGRAIGDLGRRLVGMTDAASKALQAMMDAEPLVSEPGPACSSTSISLIDMPDDEIAWFVAQAREEQQANGTVHPLAALADRVQRMHANSEFYASSQPMLLVRADDFRVLMAAVAQPAKAVRS